MFFYVDGDYNEKWYWRKKIINFHPNDEANKILRIIFDEMKIMTKMAAPTNPKTKIHEF